MARQTAGGANGHAVFPVRSANFRDWLVRDFYDLHATPPNPQALHQVIQAAYARAATAPDSDPVCYRTASVGTSTDPVLAIDLAGPEGRMIEISRSRWQILENPLHSFRRNRGCLELPQPLPPEDPPWCLSAFRLLRSLIDPSSAPLYPLPSSESELRANARSTWVLAFDNVYRMSRSVFETLCRLSSGDGFLRTERFEARGFEDRHPFRSNLQRPALLTVRQDGPPVWIPPPRPSVSLRMPFAPPSSPMRPSPPTPSRLPSAPSSTPESSGRAPQPSGWICSAPGATTPGPAPQKDSPSASAMLRPRFKRPGWRSSLHAAVTAAASA